MPPNQRQDNWFKARKSKIKWSKAAKGLGWYGKGDMLEYWNKLHNDVLGTASSDPVKSNLAMKWSSINEECGLVT